MGWRGIGEVRGWVGEVRGWVGEVRRWGGEVGGQEKLI